MKIAGPIMFFSAITLILSIVVLYFIYFLPKMLEKSYLNGILNLSFGLYLLINVLFNYLSCAFTHPGTPDSCEIPEKYFGIYLFI
jgi:hypothetical protein